MASRLGLRTDDIGIVATTLEAPKLAGSNLIAASKFAKFPLIFCPAQVVAQEIEDLGALTCHCGTMEVAFVAAKPLPAKKFRQENSASKNTKMDFRFVIYYFKNGSMRANTPSLSMNWCLIAAATCKIINKMPSHTNFE
ncbi:MAG: hypothetical protein FD163_2087 [Hyphomonadaceae bacterium]|nr:MAG: hypothetical protein FD163_2087 [Hyphomonadaceae bacterium]